MYIVYPCTQRHSFKVKPGRHLFAKYYKTLTKYYNSIISYIQIIQYKILNNISMFCDFFSSFLFRGTLYIHLSFHQMFHNTIIIIHNIFIIISHIIFQFNSIQWHSNVYICGDIDLCIYFVILYIFVILKYISFT